MKNTRAATWQHLARLERAAVLLDRVHDELRALPDNARTARLLRANRLAAEKLVRQTADTKTRLAPAAPSGPASH